MITVILCGGRGSRLSEETLLKPKPMVEIGGHPILWHIMKIYGSQGFTEFMLALGYRGEMVKDYFLHYYDRKNDLTVNLASGEVRYAKSDSEDWTVHLVDTGVDTLTGGRLRRLKDRLRPCGRFMLTYGDGVADVNLGELLKFHGSHGRLATVTAVRPPARFGGMTLDGTRVAEFKEKPQVGEGWINGGFFIFEPGVFDYLEGDYTVLEADPLERLAADDELQAYRHEGFWHPMDTVRDRDSLEGLWQSNAAPWKVW